MKTLTITILALIVLAGCKRHQVLKKPFTIVEKSTYDTGIAEYTLIDQNGSCVQFNDSTSLYHMGDTIK